MRNDFVKRNFVKIKKIRSVGAGKAAAGAAKGDKKANNNAKNTDDDVL